MAKRVEATTDPFASTERIMQTFRMARELVTFLKGEASARGLDLTAYVNRMLDGVRTWFGLPHAAATLIEDERHELGLERYEYLLHVLFQRSLDLREKGAGFDAPASSRSKKG
jgi:hypothetical protein